MNYTVKSIETRPEVDPYHRNTGGMTKTVLSIYDDGDVIVRQEADCGSVFSDEWHRRTLTFYLPHCKETELAEYLTDNELIEKIITGHSVEWNGSNMVGKLTLDASAAADKFMDELESFSEYYCYWTPNEWLGNLTNDEIGISAQTSDDEIETLADEIVKDAEVEVIDGTRVILGKYDVIDYLEVRKNV